MWGRLWGSPEVKVKKQYDRRERLAKSEDSVLNHSVHVSALSYLARKPAARQTADTEDTETWLRRRSAEVVRKNAFLTGEFEKEGADTFLVWNDPPTEESVAHCMRVVRGDATLSALLGRVRASQEGTATGGVDGLLREVAGHFVGHHAFKPAECRWMVYLVDLSAAGDGSGDYALVTALVHSLGDGHSYYKVHNMLSADAEPYALDPKRDYQLDDPAMHKYHSASSNPVMENGFGTMRAVSTWYVWLRKLAYAAVFRQPPPPVSFTYLVDRAAVEAEKKRVCAEPHCTEAFVSTNDILSSFVLRSLPPNLYYNQFMAVGTRRRISGQEDNMVGNYVDGAVFSLKDKISPTLIRRVLKNGGATTLADDAPLPYWTRFVYLFGCVTNRSTFHASLSTPMHEEVFHFPLMRATGVSTIVWIHAWTKDELAITCMVDARSPELPFAPGGLLARQLM